LAHLEKDIEQLQFSAEKLKIGSLKKHIFICTGPKCVVGEEGLKSWEHLKDCIKKENSNEFFRTKVGCLRICQKGPIGLIYPEGAWLHTLTPENIDRVMGHLKTGESMPDDLVFAMDSLGKKD